MKEIIVSEKVIEIIQATLKGFGYEQRTISPNDTAKSLSVDSLDILEAIIALEEELGIELDDEEINKCKTVQDIIDLAESITGAVACKE